MGIRKQEDGSWLADFRGNGRGSRRFRKKFNTKAEALRYEAHIKAKVIQKPEWEPPKKDSRTLKELITRWYTLHGKHLKDGDMRRRKLEKLAEISGNPQAFKLDKAWYHELRELRSTEVTPNTMNHDRAYLNAMFNELARSGEWSKANPVKEARKLKYEDRELRYLTVEEINSLLSALTESRNKSALLITKVCLATGCRWSEAQYLRKEHVNGGLVSFWDTKNGKPRHIPINEDLQGKIQAFKGVGTGRLFKDAYEAFKAAIDRAGIELPKGQMTHVLRHTFASHFIMQGGNILTLQKILDHSTITMTMRYAHLAPNHLEEAKRLNALELLNEKA